MRVLIPALLLVASAAAADPLLSPTTVRETRCTLDVTVRGGVATFVRRRTLRNDGADLATPSSILELPFEARVTGFAVAGARGIPVAARYQTLAPTAVVAADPGVLRLDEVTEHAVGYAALLAPLPPQGAVVVEETWLTPVTIDGGALRVGAPGRMSAIRGQLADCAGQVTILPGPGATVDAVQVDGVASGRAGVASFVHPSLDPLRIVAPLRFASDAPIAWTQVDDLGDGTQAVAVTVAAPPRTAAPGPLPRRVLFVIDGSRSMALVGPRAVAQVLRAIAEALPATTEIEAIVYDRRASRVLGGWQLAGPAPVARILDAVAHHAADNGSDLAAAFALAHAAIADGARRETSIAVISDGAFAAVTASELAAALDLRGATVDLHAILLDGHGLSSPGHEPLAAEITLAGGSLTEVDVDELDVAVRSVDGWLRPAWLDVAATGPLAEALALPPTLATGSGVVQIVRTRAAPHLTIDARRDRRSHVAARPGPAVALGALAVTLADPDRPRRPFVGEAAALAAVATDTRVARSRRDMLVGGGPFTRIATTADDGTPSYGRAAAAAPPRTASAISRETIERLIRDQLQPRAHACYQRALGRRPTLAGATQFELWLGRGEVIAAHLAGLGDPELDGCLLDAAYALTPPLPDPATNVDDLARVRYPLTLAVEGHQAYVVLGDADSSSPLPADALPTIPLDPSTPLGGLPPPAPLPVR
jgi:hypothetical protein